MGSQKERDGNKEAASVLTRGGYNVQRSHLTQLLHSALPEDILAFLMCMQTARGKKSSGSSQRGFNRAKFTVETESTRCLLLETGVARGCLECSYCYQCPSE